MLKLDKHKFERVREFICLEYNVTENNSIATETKQDCNDKWS
jgi:hypothetical protein